MQGTSLSETFLSENCLADMLRAPEASSSCDALDTSRVPDLPNDSVDNCPEPKRTTRGGAKRKSWKTHNHCPVSVQVLQVVRMRMSEC